MNEVQCSLASLHLYPIKSCAGLAVPEALLIETGLELDRAWMVVDHHGDMLTQREWPRLALVQTRLKADELVLRAPGMLALHLRLDVVEGPARAQVWNDRVAAFDMGDLAAQWFSDFLRPGANPAQRLRLLRFDPEHIRPCDPCWTGDLPGRTAFADGFPLLVLGEASVRDLNTRLAAAGHAAVGLQRFRPNLVLRGLEPYDEDHLQKLHIDTPQGPVLLRLVKPCTRCSIPDIDPDTGQSAPDVGAMLATYRADARVQGGITFGMNAIIESGLDCMLAAGQTARGRLHFD